MHICWGVNLTSLLFINLYRIYIYLIYFFFTPLLLNWQKEGEELREFIHACIIFLFMHICFCLFNILFMCFIEYLFIFAMHELKGELLWSFSLIHAYITPWVLSSSKRERLLAQKSITLVLMMIKSCSYSTTDLVFN